MTCTLNLRLDDLYFKPTSTIYRTRVERANHYTTDAVKNSVGKRKFAFLVCNYVLNKCVNLYNVLLVLQTTYTIELKSISTYAT